MARSSEKVRRFLEDHDISAELVELSESTRTSQMAADALGCSVAQIAKSIVFVNDGAAVVVISGDRRVDDRKLSKILGHKVSIRKPTRFVKTRATSSEECRPFHMMRM